jgi:filamentous hemagglutinin family protein
MKYILANLCAFAIASPSLAQSLGQIVPDSTQPVNSMVTVDGNNRIITGGTNSGSNLFHSFQEFSVSTGTRAIFDNPLTVDNIITRVTGGQISQIDGLIQTNGSANLFLLNPNGIIFGPNAALNVGGSFFASTAEKITFADGNEFSAINPQAPPLLNVNVPIGLQLGKNPGTIVNYSRTSINDRLLGLAVKPGQTLGLISGNLNLAGGQINAIQGKVELAAIVNSEWPLSTQENPVTGIPETSGFLTSDRLGNIQLSQQAVVNTTGLGGGEINLTGGLISLTDNSQILANTGGDFDGVGITIKGDRLTLENNSVISASTFGAGAAGDINITAGNLEVIGSGDSNLLSALLSGNFAPELLKNGIFSVTGGAGSAGNVTLNIDRLNLTGGAAILSTTLGPNRGGNLTVNATESVELFGGSLLITGSAQTGAAGDVTINTDILRMQDGSLIATSPTATSQGSGGNLTVNAGNLIEVSNIPVGRPVPGGLFTTTLGAGDAGDLTVNTRQLVLRDGAQINSSSSGRGIGGNLTINASESIEIDGTTPDVSWISGLYTSSSLLDVQGLSGSSPAGTLTVNTGRLTIRNGGIISAASEEGSAGSLQINATELLEITGVTNTTMPELAKGSSLLANSVGAGEAGDLLIQTDKLIVSDRAFITVSGEGTGNAGNLQISANSIHLNHGRLSATTASGKGGNIFLNSQTLQLRDNSSISTEARGIGDGGNITINSQIITALTNSDITANASQGFGGRVVINSQGIFGTEFRQQRTPNSDITATSELGPQFSGVVQIKAPDVDPGAGLVELKTEVVDVQSLVDRDICAEAGNSFYLTGRGGLPPTPDEPLSSDTLWIDDRPIYQSQMSTANHQITAPKIIEATGYAIAANGEITLTANPRFIPPDTANLRSPTFCHSQK